MKKNKKAFTLIELLSVIIILGVLSVLIIPKVLTSIDESEKNANIASIKNLVKTAELKIANNEVTGNTENKTINYTTGENVNYLDFSGEKPEKGLLDIKNGQIALAIKIGDNCYLKSYDSEDITYISYDESTCGANASIFAPQPTTYTVTFNSNEGSTVPSQTVPSGETATEPNNPTKEENIFGGWYLDNELTQLFDFTTPITGEITLYAKWIENSIITYTVTFNSNGGSTVSNQILEEGQTATKPNNPTRSDYMFKGWYSDSGLTQKYDFNTVATGNINLYADWVSAPVRGDGLAYIDPIYVLNDPIYYNPTNPSVQCNSGNSSSTQGTTTGCLRWYAYSFKDGVVNMILDHNVNPSNTGVQWIAETDFEDSDAASGVTGTISTCTFNWENSDYGYNCKGPLTALRKLKSYTRDWSTSVIGDYSSYRGYSIYGAVTDYTIDFSQYYKARLIAANEIGYISNATSWTITSNSEIYNIPAFLTYGLISGDTAGSISYWTGSPVNLQSYTAYAIFDTGLEHIISNFADGGIRPVITVSYTDVFND